MKVRVLDMAESEVAEVASWYEERLIGLGKRFLDAYAQLLNEIEEEPEQFGRMETVPVATNIRRALLPRFPYAIVFEILIDEVIVLAVTHLSRKPNHWINRR